MTVRAVVLVALFAAAVGACGKTAGTSGPATFAATAAPATQAPATTVQPSIGLPRASLVSPPGGNAAGSAGMWSHCGAATDVSDPGQVRGLFVAGANQINNAGVAAAVLRYLPSDPTICGANLIIPWSAIDRGPGANPQYDWSYLDQAAGPWWAAGKLVNLIVWGTDEKTSQEVDGTPATPAYVLSATDTVSCPDDGRIPVYWEPGYAQPWHAFEAAVVAHVAADPKVGYVRFGLGTGGEDFPAGGFSQGACLGAWVKSGLTATRWLAWSIAEIDFEASLGSDHPLNVGINSFPDAPQLPDEVAAEAARQGMGFGMQGMTDAQTRLAQSNPHLCYADWCSLFATWAGRVPLEVQTLSPTTPAGGGTSGALPGQLAYVVSVAHAQVLELYPQEWLVADDPSWPAFAQYHDAYARALSTAASEVGG